MRQCISTFGVFNCMKQFRNQHLAVNPGRAFSFTFLAWTWLQRLTFVTFQNVNICWKVCRCFSLKTNITVLVLKGREMQRIENHQRLQELKRRLPSREGRDQKRRHAKWKWFAYQTVLSTLFLPSTTLSNTFYSILMKGSDGYCEPGYYWLHHHLTLISLEQHPIILKGTHLERSLVVGCSKAIHSLNKILKIGNGSS